MREKQNRHREKSKRDPSKYLTIIVDRIDQNETNLPELPRIAKSAQNLWTLHSHLTGCLVDTCTENGKMVYAFLNIMEYPHDLNLVIQVIIIENSKKVSEKESRLPEVLYLQFNNCFKKNKNKYIFTFCSLLILKGVFKKVCINFLPVGHTHDDVDEFYSKISTNLSRVAAETISS
uniref:DUF7869 domain-containing protein n=1 Tax=Amphimedon queenslandica TaxID=400682 RepID=A0A1X7UA55_AMPQE